MIVDDHQDGLSDKSTMIVTDRNKQRKHVRICRSRHYRIQVQKNLRGSVMTKMQIQLRKFYHLSYVIEIGVNQDELQ